mmetsp:Transcript_762/g.1002  ORF Transcript_762/g.1002 Transcript_762/m.1002 type:complete len:207 (+) Transcript_762:534-1154(+)
MTSRDHRPRLFQRVLGGFDPLLQLRLLLPERLSNLSQLPLGVGEVVGQRRQRHSVVLGATVKLVLQMNDLSLRLTQVPLQRLAVSRLNLQALCQIQDLRRRRLSLLLEGVLGIVDGFLQATDQLPDVGALLQQLSLQHHLAFLGRRQRDLHFRRRDAQLGHLTRLVFLGLQFRQQLLPRHEQLALGVPTLVLRLQLLARQFRRRRR